METFFGIRTEYLALGAAGVLAVALVALGLRAWRWPVFLRLGVRQLPRRPGQTALIVAGLTLSSALVSASLATGDTITFAIRNAAVAELGRLDALVTYSLPPRPGGQAGGSPLVSGNFFSAAIYERLAADYRLKADVAALAPALRFDCTMVNATSRQTSFATIVGLPADYDRGFGSLLASEGKALDFGALRPGQVYANETSGAALAAKPGDELVCTAAGVPLRLTVAAVATKGGLDSSSTVNVYARIDYLQEQLHAAGVAAGVERPINQVLVANRGDLISSAQRTDAVGRSIGAVLFDNNAYLTLHHLLKRNDLRAAIGVRRGTLGERAQTLLQELLALADRPAGDDAHRRQFGTLFRNDGVRNAVFAAARDASASDPELVPALEDAYVRAYGFRVQALKEQVLLFADRAGNVITTIFLLFSLLSIAASVLLVFLIFSLLAASRRAELGITRALGTERGHLVAMFTYEGIAYALLAALVGVPAGLAISRGLVGLLVWAVESGAAGFTGTPQRIAETVRWHAEPRSIALAGALGLLLTVLTVSIAAWRVSRLTIVSAIRDLPEPPVQRRSLTTWWWAGLFVLGGAAIALGLWRGETFPFAAGVSALVLGVGGAVRHLGRAPWGRDVAGRAGATVAGTGLTAYWALPFDAQQRLGLPRLTSGIEIFALGGVLMIAGVVWALAANGDWAARLLSWFLTQTRRGAPALRLAAAHSLRQPVRTGLTMAMFGLVIFMLTVMQVVTAAALHFHADPETVYGGWNIEGQTRAASPTPAGQPAQAGEVPAAPGAEAPAARPEGANAPAAGPTPAPSVTPSAALRAVPGQAVQRPELRPAVAAAGLRTAAFFALIQLDAPRPAWGGYQVVGIDPGFAGGNRIPLQARASGYGSDRAVWEAVGSGTGLAVIDAHALPSQQLRITPSINAATFILHGVARERGTIQPQTVWIGNPTGATAAKVTIIGLVDRRAATSFRGLHVSQAQLDALGTPLRPPAQRLYFRTQPGADVNETRALLGDAFFGLGLETVNLNERFVNESGPLLLASRMLQLFVGLGLFVGIAALAVISTRAALERRQMIGILRAIGYGRGAIRGSLLLESTLVVVLGSGIGVGLGLLLCRNVFAVQFFDRFQRGMSMVVPWDQLALTVGLTCAAALLATWLPATHASRIPPIAALREA